MFKTKADVVGVVLPTRKVRRVPFGWKHPQVGDMYLPLLPAEWLDEEAWAEWGQDHPDPSPTELLEFESRYMPDFQGVPDALMGLAVYETTTEGTPVTPIFPDTPEGRFGLVDYCRRRVPVFGDQLSDSLEEWCRLLFGPEAELDSVARTVALSQPTDRHH